MHNSGGGGGGGSLRAEDVISKLKDDGDFDRLRIKIIRKFKENEELRGNIISLVKQSAVLNSPGAENMKPRQLSDAIHGEIGDKLMSQVSDGLWNIIRSTDGMKREITETVQSVYQKMINPLKDDNCPASFRIRSDPVHSEIKDSLDTSTTSADVFGSLSDGELNEPPGFGLSDLHHCNKTNQIDQGNKSNAQLSSNKRKAREVKGKKSRIPDATEPNKSELGDTPPWHATDEDPDVPPGFG